MTNRVKHLHVLSKPLLFTGGILLAIALLTLGLYFFKHPIDVVVTLNNAGDGSQVSEGYIVTAEYNQTAEIKDGRFYLSDIKSNAQITITGPGLFSPVRLDVDNRREIAVSLNANFENTIEVFVRNLQLRQYRKNYDVMAEEEKAKVGVDIFLKDMNAWQDDLLSRGLEIHNISYRIDSQNIERRGSLSGAKYTDVTKIILSWNIIGSSKEYNPETAAYFTLEEGQVKWLFDREFLP